MIAASVGMAQRQCGMAVVRTWRPHLETPVSKGVDGQHGVPSVRKIMWRSTNTGGMKARRTGDNRVGVHYHSGEIEHCNKGSVSASACQKLRACDRLVDCGTLCLPMLPPSNMRFPASPSLRLQNMVAPPRTMMV